MEIVSKSVDVAVDGGIMPGWLSRPTEAGRYPGVIVLMEAFGLNQHIKRIVERIAAEGYVALAPDLYFREPNNVVGYDDLPSALRLMSTIDDQRVVEDLSAAIAWLEKQEFVRGDRIGMIGFCMGGRLTFLTACRNPAVRFAAPFYGGGIARVFHPSERTPCAPLDYAEQLSCPMQLFFGGDDPFIPLADVHEIEKRLADLGKDASVTVYQGAPHGFFCEDRDSYRSEPAADAWARVLEGFRRHLKA